jgi:hypothetical protein
LGTRIKVAGLKKNGKEFPVELSISPQRRKTVAQKSRVGPKAVRPHPGPAATRDALRLVLETALDAVVVMKSDGVVPDWNDRAAGVFAPRARRGLTRHSANGDGRSALRSVMSRRQPTNETLLPSRTEVIEKLRLIFSTDPPTKAPLDVNKLIREVITLVRGEIENERVSLAR